MSLIDRWHQALAEDTRPPGDFLRHVEAAGAIHAGRPLCVHRRPHFVSTELVKDLARTLTLFHGALRRLRQGVLEQGWEGPLVRGMALDPRALELARIHPGYESAALITRVDCFETPEGPRFLELNGESPAGIAYADALTAVFDADPLGRLLRGLTQFRSTDAVVRAVLDTWQEWGGLGLPQVAIVDFREVPTAPEFVLFRQRFRAQGMGCTIADPRDLEWDGQRLRHGDQVLEVVYRRVLVQDMLDRPNDCDALLRAYRAGAICMVNSLRSPLLHGKGLFALLHDPEVRRRLTPAQRKSIDRTIPRTVLVDDEAREQARSHREELVLKPIDGHAGQGVVLGWRCSESEWDDVLQASTRHVLQQRVPEQRLPFPDARLDNALRECLVDLDPFLIRGRFAGFLCRVSEGTLANVSTGASQVPVYALPSEGS